MAKPTAKRAAKSPSKPSITLPDPFSLPFEILQPFLKTLDPSHIYITHVDSHPWTFKRRVFSVPILMNVVIVFLLAWRAYIALPAYAAIALATLGYDNEEKVDMSSTDWASLLWVIAKRALMFLCDWALFRFILPWPIDFFLGSPENPVSWRRTVGFQDKEIVVRVSRKWDKTLPQDWVEKQKDGGGEMFQERIMPAIDPGWVQGKTGYLMMDKSWDLDFAGMITAHQLVISGKASLEDFQKTVIVHSEPYGWLVWPVHKLDAGSNEAGRQKIVAFKDRLTAMGKENLFFRWIEIIQYESTLPGGFTSDRQAVAMAKAKELFEAQGVDFERFWRDVGGMEGMPGLVGT
ncbi:MAG: hypothetical protein M1830_006905 [Pleopsidium flavum]|nr:MAG: hypothetical protein M1830_006905 [Pleopsidium flavum]